MRIINILLYCCCIGAISLFFHEQRQLTTLQDRVHDEAIASRDLSRLDQALVDYMAVHHDKVPYEMDAFVEVMHKVNADTTRFEFPIVNVVGQSTYNIDGSRQRGWRLHTAPHLTITRHRDHGRDGRPEMGAGILYVDYTVGDLTMHKIYYDGMSQKH